MPGEQLTIGTEWVELSLEERAQRGRDLADALRQMRQLEAEHAEQKAAMKRDREALQGHIDALVFVVVSAREERPVGRER